MTKSELKLAFDQYLMDLKKQAFSLIDENNYDNILEVMQDCVTKIKPEKKKPELQVICGEVHKEGVLMEIGEGEYLPIFGEELEDE